MAQVIRKWRIIPSWQMFNAQSDTKAINPAPYTISMK